MAIDGVRANTPTSAKAGLVAGQQTLPAEVIEARVAAVLENNLVRFLTAFGPLDLAVDQPVTVGDRARILVENTGARMTLTLVSTNGQPASGTAAARAAGAPSAAASGAPPSSAPATPAPDAAAQAAQAMARAAAARQQPPSVLLARLASVLAEAPGALPPEVRSAAAEVMARTLRIDTALGAEALREAVQRSGVFHEALQAAGRPPADLKQALTVLRSVLEAWSPSARAEPATAPPGPAAMPAAAGTAPPAAGALPTPPAVAGPPAPVPASAPAPGEPTARPAAPAGQPLPPSAMSAAAPLAAAAATLPPVLLRQLVARAFGSGEATAAGHGEAADRPLPPPRSDAPPRAQAPERAPPGFAELPPTELREALLSATEAAVDRIKLSQYASLPREAAAPPPPGATASPTTPVPQAWVLDVPLLAGREATLAQMRVTRDGHGPGSEAEGPVWSLDVALDTTQTGPVHARVRLGAGRLGVTLWAERPDMAARLREEMPALRRTLDDAAFIVDDVAVLDGAPAAPPRRGSSAGYLLDTRS